jgi:hypothetical protein
MSSRWLRWASYAASFPMIGTHFMLALATAVPTKCPICMLACLRTAFSPSTHRVSPQGRAACISWFIVLQSTALCQHTAHAIATALCVVTVQKPASWLKRALANRQLPHVRASLCLHMHMLFRQDQAVLGAQARACERCRRGSKGGCLWRLL